MAQEFKLSKTAAEINEKLENAVEIKTMTSAEYDLLPETNVNNLYILTDVDEESLVFDEATTQGSSNPVTSGGVYEAIANLQTEVDGKQDTLTFDDTPTADSTNPVTSAGIKTALDNMEEYVITVTDGVTDKTLMDILTLGHTNIVVHELFSYDYGGLSFKNIPLVYRYSHVKVRSVDGYFVLFFYCVLDGVLREYKLVGSMSDGANSPLTAILTETNITETFSALQTEVDGKADAEHTHDQYLTEIPSEYVTETELTAKKYLTAVPSKYVTKTELKDLIFTYGTSDLTAGSSTLETGKLYFVYE